MEKMTLLKTLAFGVPEVVMCILIGLAACRSDVKKDWKAFIIKLVLSVAVVLSVIYIYRQLSMSMKLNNYILLILYAVTFKLVWQMNYRQSILASCITEFILGLIEIATLPLYDFLLKTSGINSQNFDILFSPILRLPQIIMVMVFMKWNLRNNELLCKKWHDLNKYFKIGIIVIMLSIVWCTYAFANYADFNYLLIQNKLMTDLYKSILNRYFWTVLWFFIFLLFLIYYVYNFLQTQKMLDISPRDLINILGEESDENEIKEYIHILQNKYNKGEISDD